ncbi:hypothetical protein ACOSQ2_003724 [Xanthoceras sorbifolium]
MAQTKHVVLLPSPGMGHVIPFIEFAKRLVHHHDDFNVTCIIPTIGPPSTAMKAAVEALPAPTINHIFLPPIIFDDDDQYSTKSPETILALAITRSLPSLACELKSLVASSRTNVVAFVVDFFCTETFEVAREFNLSSYLFFPSNAMVLSFLLYLPKLDEMVSCEFKDLTEPVKIPGCLPVHGRDFADTFQDRTSGTYKWFVDMIKKFSLARGIIVNSFMDLESGALKALSEEEPGKPPVYPIGPIIRSGSSESDDVSWSDCLTWLDNQPSDSVLFVAFGSGGTLSHAQVNELAFGLEMSQQRFIWVVKTPNDESASATYFSVQNHQKNHFDFLPEGFLERTKERGLVISSWGPQIEVLSHGATGGFLTHCGWNSTLESVVYGVPLIAWPLYAEQRMNALMLSEDVRVALRPNPNEGDGLVTREEIAKVVKELMEGEAGIGVRKRMRVMKHAASMALMEDGSSIKTLSKLALEWKKNQTASYGKTN